MQQYNMEEVLEICRKKAELHMDNYGEKPFDYSACKEGSYEKESTKNDLNEMTSWMSSFVTGLAPIHFWCTKDTKFLKWANKFKSCYHDKVFVNYMKTMHDIGFLYSPYSVAMYNLTGDEEHKITALKAADELLKRFDIKGGYIDAWNSMAEEDRVGRAIIDCMMNVSLLLWAWKQTSHTIYKDVAAAHIETTKKYFIRDDLSVAHSYLFDRKTGKMIKEDNNCGYSNGSHWARGTAWAVYGFAVAARYLDNKEYYEIAEKIAKKYISEIPDGKFVPMWDFRLPKEYPAKFCGKIDVVPWDETDEKNKEYAVDTSAAAVMACGIYELNSVKENASLKEFADKTIENLCTEKYFDDDIKHTGILKRQNGRMDYTTFGDYFFTEALARKLYKMPVCW
ncbi:MAG: glycoside hydrolase family 88 protein [Clostridia bacterium]|nr:glycoside hydrolase family 88 protein [Clostridia bacterium]